MKKEIAEKWVAALRSGKYEQGQRHLCARLGAAPWQYCCLGVLCDLAEAEGAVQSRRSSLLPSSERLDSYREYGRSSGTGVLPREVAAWAGMRSLTGRLPKASMQDSLVHMNDDGKTFETIADAIETYKEEL